MKNWKVILPVLVALVIVGYALSTKQSPEAEKDMMAPGADDARMMEEPVDTGAPTGDADVDALIDEISASAALEADAMYEGDADLGAEEGDAELFNGEYYAE